MSIATTCPYSIDFFGRPLVFQISHGPLLSPDAGLLLFRRLDEYWKFTESFAAALNDPRAPNSRSHTTLEMVRQRVYGLLADYEDQSDAEEIRSDPVFKLI